MRLLLALLALPLFAADLRVGIIGTDTSHAIEFTKFLNDPSNPNHIPGAKVVAAYKGGSKDNPHSWDRVEKYADELKSKYNVEIVDDIATLAGKVDAILLESVDGREHLKQFQQVLKAGKPVFIDKPLASTYADAKEIARLAKQANVPWFTASALRFSEHSTKMNLPGLTGVITWGPGTKEPHHQLDLSWYAIHATEILFTLMGPGCQEVTRVVSGDEDVVTCRWSDGRLGTVRTLPEGAGYGVVVFQKNKITQMPADVKFSYKPLLSEIVKFFETRQPPVPNADSLAMFAFMDAAQRSKESGGKPVKVKE